MSHFFVSNYIYYSERNLKTSNNLLRQKSRNKWKLFAFKIMSLWLISFDFIRIGIQKTSSEENERSREKTNFRTATIWRSEKQGGKKVWKKTVSVWVWSFRRKLIQKIRRKIIRRIGRNFIRNNRRNFIRKILRQVRRYSSSFIGFGWQLRWRHKVIFITNEKYFEMWIANLYELCWLHNGSYLLFLLISILKCASIMSFDDLVYYNRKVFKM